MTDQSESILISYPSGGFGNFIFHALTEFSDSTYKPNNQSFKFSNNGNSHSTKKYTNKWFRDPDSYIHNEIITDKKILILCDNGIFNDSYINIRKHFKKSTIIRICLTNHTRPVIYKTCTSKAQNSDPITESKTQINLNWSDSDEDYAVRENFTLLYHNWPFGWHEVQDENIINLNLESLISDPVNTMRKLIVSTGGNVINIDKLIQLCADWTAANSKYFKIYYDWLKINSALDSIKNVEIRDITDLHDQGYINYCIERKYNVIIPVYDYKEWFADTSEILIMVKKLKYVQNKISVS